MVMCPVHTAMRVEEMTMDDVALWEAQLLAFVGYCTDFLQQIHRSTRVAACQRWRATQLERVWLVQTLQCDTAK